MWENNEYKMYFREDTVLDFERVMLSSGVCSNLLPMVFVGENNSQVAYYDCNGFIPLNKYRIERTEDAFFILEKVLLILSNVVEYLITPSKITLSTDTVFYNTESGEIKLAYVPAPEDSPDLKHNIILLISQLKADVKDSHVEYLNEFSNMVAQNNYHIRDLVNKAGMTRRKLYNIALYN